MYSLENIPSVVKEFSALILLLNFVSLVEFSHSLLGYCYWPRKIISLGQKIHLNIATLDFIPRESLNVWWKEKWIKAQCVYTQCMHSLMFGEPTRRHVGVGHVMNAKSSKSVFRVQIGIANTHKAITVKIRLQWYKPKVAQIVCYSLYNIVFGISKQLHKLIMWTLLPTF